MTSWLKCEDEPIEDAMEPQPSVGVLSGKRLSEIEESPRLAGGDWSTNSAASAAAAEYQQYDVVHHRYEDSLVSSSSTLPYSSTLQACAWVETASTDDDVSERMANRTPSPDVRLSGAFGHDVKCHSGTQTVKQAGIRTNK